MRSTLTRHTFALLGLAATSGLTQAQQLTLEALTPTTVNAGGSVDFLAKFTKFQRLEESAFSSMEPPPVLGDQTWQESGSQTDSESLERVAISFSLGDQVVQGAVDLPTGYVGGTLYTLTVPFSLAFSSVGQFTVAANARWESTISSGSTLTTGERRCTDGGDQGLSCTEWTYTAVGGSSISLAFGEVGPMTVNVSVVPEPQTWALWLGGLGLLAAGARRRRCVC